MSENTSISREKLQQIMACIEKIEAILRGGKNE